VNPTIKTQYSESWFLNVEREFAKNWVVELGYVGTNGVNLERLDDINRIKDDLLDPAHFNKLRRVNSNFGALTWVTNGVSSSYNAGNCGGAPQRWPESHAPGKLPILEVARHEFRYAARTVHR